jgi:hypothetical protein
MNVKQLELLLQDHLVHRYGQRQGIRRILEERVPVHLHLVEVYPLGEMGQAEGLSVRDEVDLVTPLRQLETQLRRDGP